MLWIVVPKNEGPWNCKEIKPVNPQGNQHWIFNERVDAEVPKLWSPDSKSQLISKDPDVGKDWGKEKGMTGWDGWMASPLNRHESETLGDSKGKKYISTLDKSKQISTT